MLIPGQSPGIKEQLVDLYGKPEILFFGPDGQIVLNSMSALRADMSQQRAQPT